MALLNRVVPSIPTVGLPGGLADNVSPLPAGWERGIAHRNAIITGATDAFGVCDDDAVSVSGVGDVVDVNPFVVRGQVRCGMGSRDEIEGIVRSSVDASYSTRLARELVVSSVGSPDLSDDSTDITAGSGATNFRNSLGGLLSALDLVDGGNAMIHIPIVMLPRLSEIGVEVRDGRYWLGMIPVSVDHYPPVDGIPTDHDEVWLYLTGTVEAGRTEIVVDSDYLDTENTSSTSFWYNGLIRFNSERSFRILSKVAL